MSDEDNMRLAIDVAKDAEASGGAAIGAIMVKDGKVIAQGLSNPWGKRDPSNHGEIDCIRNTAKDNDLMDMQGCTLYGTLEPCSMCVGAALWAGVDRIVFGAYAEDVAGNDYEYDNYSSEELAKTSRKAANPSRGKIEIIGGVLHEECKELLKDYKEWQKQ
ncbi:nucleoside deaminase [Candidatus Saccharibacteria bacterium]|nr:MAG: nucleoside deaminase [Candidatus Saccharibacteria bacterium]